MDFGSVWSGDIDPLLLYMTLDPNAQEESFSLKRASRSRSVKQEREVKVRRTVSLEGYVLRRCPSNPGLFIELQWVVK